MDAWMIYLITGEQLSINAHQKEILYKSDRILATVSARQRSLSVSTTACLLPDLDLGLTSIPRCFYLGDKNQAQI